MRTDHTKASVEEKCAQEYLNFLIDIVGTPDHTLLLKQLHGIEFYVLVPNDDNRFNDGLKLREIFLYEKVEKMLGGKHTPDSLPKSGSRRGKDQLSEFKLDLIHYIQNLGPCTVLEMLIGLAHRLEFQLTGHASEMPVAGCFWKLMDHLGLMHIGDDIWLEPGVKEDVEDRIYCMLDRKYDRKGNGSLFPIKKPNKDMRQVEIWYQMMAWVCELMGFPVRI